MAPSVLPEGFRNRPLTILGAGVLGRRIAACWVSGGYDVRVRDPSDAQCRECIAYVKEHASTYPAALASIHPLGNISVYTDLAEAVQGAWLVIEAVPENLGLKIVTFADLEALAPADAIFASNSSSYKSSEMLERVGDAKRRILNTHYYMPPQVMVVELMTDGYTDPAIISFMFERQKECGTVPYVARKESTGLIFNRLWAAIKREVLTILSEGVSVPKEIDDLWYTMFVKAGNRGGPCQMMDAVGLDTVAFIEQHYIAERGLPSDKTVDYLQRNYIDKGKLGQKSDKGGLFPRIPRLLVLDIGLAAQTLTATPGFVLEISGDGKTQKVLLSSMSLPDGIDVDRSLGRMFWTCMGYPGKNDGAVYSAALDGSDVATVVPPGQTNTPKQLAVEPKSKKLFFCDREGMRVFSCSYDGSGLQELINLGDWHTEPVDQTKWCVGITVAPKYGKFYWSQKGASKSGQGRLFCASIEMPPGKNAKTRDDIQMLMDKLPEPVDLEIEEDSDTLYWTDRGELPFGNSVNKVDLSPKTGLITDTNSSRRYQVLVRHLNEAIGLKLDVEAGHMYLTDLGGALYRCDLDGKNKQKIYSSDDRALTGICIL
ncbi:3-hydroxyacyl-CoA dehydrogenase [Xylariales sp. PMI_506]|nr:3-hydroxyacyl-CoA dehydrogenase [Xylariales sp. PMI_506]